MRCDQFIGKTQAGDKIFEKLMKMPNAIIETSKICTLIFDNNDVYGDKITYKDRIYVEELQEEMWSSGPMYFTHIAIYNTNTGELIGYIGSWKEDKNLKYDFDYEKGTYWL